MKRGRQRPGRIDQLTSLLHIDAAIWIDDSEGYSVSSQPFCHRNVSMHSLHFVLAVTEITSAGTDHHMQPNANMIAYDRDRTLTWSHTAFHVIAKQFHPIRPTCFGCQRCIDRVGRDFHQNFSMTHLCLQKSASRNLYANFRNHLKLLDFNSRTEQL